MSKIDDENRYLEGSLIVRLCFFTVTKGVIFSLEEQVQVAEIFNSICSGEIIRSKILSTNFHKKGGAVHLVINFHSQTEISKLVGTLKSRSSKVIKEKLPKLANQIESGNSFWARPYVARTTGEKEVSQEVITSDFADGFSRMGWS